MILLGWACLLLAAIPALLTLLNLPVLRRPDLAAGAPCLSVLIPARNEEANIGPAVAAILASRGVALEVVVLDDASTDGTRAVLDAIEDSRLRVLAAPPLPPGWSGKQHACHVLSRYARHEMLVFVDADVRLAPDALSRMAGYMQRSGADLGSGFPRQITATWSERLLLPLIHFLLLGFLPMRRARRRPDVALAAGCGQMFIARRTAYRHSGGHGAIRASLHDGLTLPRAFRRAGWRTGLFDATELASCRMYTGAAPLLEGLCKNATEGMATLRALPLWTLLLGGGQVAPWPLLALAPSWPAGGAALLGLGTRLVLAARFRQSLLSALLHPLGVAGLLAIQWYALARAAGGGRATWRGRAYVPQ